jgi:tetratricopeptide (TPR) repeat protein
LPCAATCRPLSVSAPTSNPRWADAALERDKPGRALLPPELQPDFDRIIHAFAQLEAGQDDAARDTLGAIGLRSPFLEWKLALRGLQAYYVSDDVRALENWGRLDPARVPARLVAPLRAQIDPAFRQAQPPAVQARLARHLDRMQTNLGAQLRAINAQMHRDGMLASLFRQVEPLVPLLRQQAPHLLPRLAACFYNEVLMHGGPDDVPRYLRVFGNPPDDVGLHRLQALGNERGGLLADAHKHWQQFEKQVGQNPAAWPADQARAVRALVWQHMGRNADSIPDEEDEELLPDFFRYHPKRPRPLKPDAETCFRRSLELAPELLETHEDLFHHLLRTEEDARAVTAGRELLARFPDNVQALCHQARLLQKTGAYAEAVELVQRAYHLNPLDRDLRGRLGHAHVLLARHHAEEERFDEARTAFAAALPLWGGDLGPVYCKMAACEFKAGDKTRGEEYFAQALEQAGDALAASYSMLIEVIRLKLPGAYKTRFNKAFNEGLAAPPTGQAAAQLAQTTANHEGAGITYLGQQTHRKKVLDYLKKASKVKFTQQELETVCDSLIELDAYRLAKTYTTLGQRTFRDSPLFFLMDARNEMARGPGVAPPYQVRFALEQARLRAEKLPPDPAREKMLEEIDNRLRAVEALNPFAQMFGSFDPFDPYGDDDDDDYDDEFF